MNKYLWPWQSQVLMYYPWALPAFFAILSIPLSIVSWKRSKK
ncbi:hypothetical protein [Bacillus sp. OTU530]